MSNLLNLPSIEQAPVKSEPYPHFVVDQAIVPEAVVATIRDFPRLPDGGSYNIDSVKPGPQFQQLIESIDSPEFRRILCDKFDVDIMDLPMMITLRGHSRAKDGRIHTDSKTKVLTILIYMNEEWTAETGRLRVLRSKSDMNDFADEILPGPGNLFAFKVTDNGWHGYPSFEGKRQSIQINFLTGGAAGTKHKFFHGLSAKLKGLKKSGLADDY